MAWMTIVRERTQRRMASAHRYASDHGSEHPLGGTGGDGVDDGSVPRSLRVAGAWAWRLVGIGLVVYGLITLIGLLRIVVIPVVVALLLAALLQPAAALLRRRGLNKSLAAAIVLVAGLVVVVGGLTLIVQTFISQLDDLTTQVQAAFTEIQNWLSQGPLHLDPQVLKKTIDGVGKQLSDNKGALAAGALTTAATLGEVVASIFLVLLTLFFFLRDGAQIWEFLCRLLPRPARVPTTRAGRYSWLTLVSYVRATVLVAFVDAVGIGVGLEILRVPLALPLAALVFLSSFIPVIGATLSGSVAVLVALVTQGPVSALIVLAIVIAVQQLEGHVLQPLIMGRAVALHPLAIILAIATGVVAAGIVGGLVAVPLLAIANTAIRYLVHHPGGEPISPDETPGTRSSDAEQAEIEESVEEAAERGDPHDPASVTEPATPGQGQPTVTPSVAQQRQ
jgi:predicted PurR-regulated permease PerM